MSQIQSIFRLRLLILVGLLSLIQNAHPSDFQSELSLLKTANISLANAYEQLDETLYDTKTKRAEAINGKLLVVVNEIAIADTKVKAVVDKLPIEKSSVPEEIQDSIFDVGQNAVRISSRGRLGFEVSPDSPLVFSALERAITLAERISKNVSSYASVLWDKVVPVRFVQAQSCFAFMQTCTPLLEWDSIQAAIRAMNEAFSPADLHFSTSSIERYTMYHLANESWPKDTLLDYDDVYLEVAQVFSIPAPPVGITVTKKANSWIGYLSTLYSDPNELLVWVFSRDALVSRENDGHSISSLPHGGRSLTISAQNIYDPNRPPDQPALSPYHLAHEVGHFFGLFHPWDTPGGRHPVEIRDVDWADLWDLSYCHGDLGFPLFFTSRADALANQCTMEPIEDHYCPCGEYDDSNNCTCPVPPNCSVDNRYGADDSDMHCIISYGNYYSDDPALKGLSFYLNEPELPPDSFAYGLNVMGYYSRYNAHLWTPGRFSSSQIAIISGHANNSVPIVVDYGVPGLLSDRDNWAKIELGLLGTEWFM